MSRSERKRPADKANDNINNASSDTLEQKRAKVSKDGEVVENGNVDQWNMAVS